MLEQHGDAWGEELYYLNRDTLESRRLDIQHGIWTDSLEYCLHPEIRANIPSDPVIADIGTGTGVWLLDVATSYQGRGRFIGLDVSAAQYPAQEHLPANVRLEVGDMKKPFPAQMHGTFDVVHCRLLVLALAGREWGIVARNLKTLLKPGGYIQWEELDPMSRQVLRAGSPAETQTKWMQYGFDHLVKMTGDRTLRVPNKLLAGIREAGFNSISRDVVCTDRKPELRHRITVNETGVVMGVCKQQAAAGVAGAWTLEDTNAVVDHMLEEARTGAYVNVYIHCCFARNPKRTSKL